MFVSVETIVRDHEGTETKCIASDTANGKYLVKFQDGSYQVISKDGFPTSFDLLSLAAVIPQIFQPKVEIAVPESPAEDKVDEEEQKKLEERADKAAKDTAKKAKLEKKAAEAKARVDKKAGKGKK